MDRDIYCDIISSFIQGWVRCLHCHGDVYLPDGGGDSLDKDRCYYCQHSKHGHGHMECGNCQVLI